MEHLKLFCNIKRHTQDLIHKTESSSAVGFILILSDPDVELGRLITAVIVVELQALDFAVSCWGHYLALQSGGVPPGAREQGVLRVLQHPLFFFCGQL